MEKQRHIKILSIIALVVAIAGMSLGFAAFSATLNISSSATVTPDSSNFKVTFSTSSSTPGEHENITYTKTGSAEDASQIVINNTSVMGLNAKIVNPGDSIIYNLFAYNEGLYNAYLNKIIFNNIDGLNTNKKCVKIDETASDELVQAACESIKLQVIYDKREIYEQTTDTFEYLLSPYTVDETYDSVGIKISYDENGPRADGEFYVEFGGIDLVYSTIGQSTKLITFTLNVDYYEAEEGMTFLDWINSPYNESGWTEDYTYCDYKGNVFDDLDQVVIEDGGMYTFGINCV